MLLLQEFEFDIQNRIGTQHVVVDYLSKIENEADAVDGDDDFHDGEPFTLKPRTRSRLMPHMKIDGSQK